MKKILSMMGIALLMASCTEDYKDWADPITNGPEEPISVGITASPASPVDFATLTAESVQLFNAQIVGVEGATATYGAEITNEDGSQSEALEVDQDGYVSAAALEAAVYTLWGRRPVARTIPVNIVGLVNVNGASFAATASTTLTATPNAPDIEDAYYITGSINGWDNTNTDYELTNGGDDPYENPVFTVMIPASVVTGDFEFKVTPKSGLGGDWSKCLTASDTEGSFATDNAGGNLKVSYVEGAKFYRVSFNMMEQTWSAAGVSFGDFFYEIGNESGWGTSNALYGADSDGKYQGYYYLDGEFKFKPNADNWDNDLEYVSGTATSGSLTADGGPNCPDPGAGFYRIDLDAGTMNYSLKRIDVVSIIGTVNGNWDTDTDLTYNVEEGCWEVTTDMNAGEFKFRGNHNWDGDVDLGGTIDNLVHGGSNIAIMAGNYTVKLYISYAGKHHCTITKN